MDERDHGPGRRRPPRLRPLAAAEHGRLADLARSLRALVSYPVRQIPGSNRRILTMADLSPPWIDALVNPSAPGAPHDWAEVYRPAPGVAYTLLDGGRSGTGNAYEVNDTPLPDPRVVRLWPTGGGGDYTFEFHRVANPCRALLTVMAFGCDGPLVGAVVTVKDADGNVVPYEPGVSDTCTIGLAEAGNACSAPAWCVWTNVTPGATYTVHIDPPAHYVSPVADRTITLECNNNYVRFTCPTDLTDPHYDCIDSDYACCAPCSTPPPRTLSLDDGHGTVTLTFTGYTTDALGNLFANWEAQADRTGNCNFYILGTDAYGNVACIDSGSQSASLHFKFSCFHATTGTFTPETARGYSLEITFHYCYTGTGTCYLGDTNPAVWGGTQKICGTSASGVPFYTPPAGWSCDPPYFPLSVPAPCMCNPLTFAGYAGWEAVPCSGSCNGGLGGIFLDSWPCPIPGSINLWTCFYDDPQLFTITA